jgi:hypothetical protein
MQLIESNGFEHSRLELNDFGLGHINSGYVNSGHVNSGHIESDDSIQVWVIVKAQ